MQIEVGDLVRVLADNCDFGPGLVVEVERDEGPSRLDQKSGDTYRVLTSDGQCLYYLPYELHPLFAQEIQAEWTGP